MRRLQELREKAILDENSAFKTGLKRGEEKGERQSKMKMAKDMLKKNIAIEIIEEITQLSRKEINELK